MDCLSSGSRLAEFIGFIELEGFIFPIRPADEVGRIYRV